MAKVQRYAKKLSAFFDFADKLSDLSCCKRAQVGAVVFPFDCSAVYALGYNGPARGRDNDSCTEEEGRCGCAHAEANAIATLDPSRVKRPTFMYCTHTPCVACANAILNCGAISVVFHRNQYRDMAGILMLQEAGIVTCHVDQVTGLSDWFSGKAAGWMRGDLP